MIKSKISFFIRLLIFVGFNILWWISIIPKKKKKTHNNRKGKTNQNVLYVPASLMTLISFYFCFLTDHNLV